ncbi:MAG: restriction endonuclease subunit S, partial [Nitrospinota bacterium]
MKFCDCAELVRETCQPEESFGKPYIGLENIEQGTLRLNSVGIAEDVTSTKSNFKNGDILFGKLRPYFRKVVRPKFEGICSTDIWVVRAKDGIDQGFLFYWMASTEFVDIANQGSEGTKMPRAKWDFVAKIKQTIPPLPEQKAIASILGALDDKIELNRKMNETLEAMARAIFKSWFVGFDPIPGYSPHKEWQDSPLGKIPKGWRVEKVSDICTTQYGYTASASEEPIGPHFLRITDMNKEPWIDWQKVPYCSINDKDLSKYTLQVGDVLVSRMADPGKAAIVEDNVNAVFASYLVRLKTRDLATAYYLFYFLRSNRYLDYANGVMDGTVQAG